MAIIEALTAIQASLKSPKDQNAGRYRYRNIEDVNEAVKPLAAAHGCAVIYSDEFIDGVCVSTCTLTNGEESISVKAFALVNQAPKGMSIEQSCGSASSYARKFCAAGLFALDSSEKDPDRVNANVPQQETESVDVEIVRAKKRMWDAVCRWAELHGEDQNAEAESIKQRPDYRPTRVYFEQVANEYANKAVPHQDS